MKTIKSHELARKLLEGPNLDVVVHDPVGNEYFALQDMPVYKSLRKDRRFFIDEPGQDRQTSELDASPSVSRA